jgi:hypothetical protein
MPTRVGPPGSARVAISGTNSGHPYANVFWANLVGGATATQAALDAWLTGFGQAYINAFQPRMTSTVEVTLAQATLFQSATTALHSAHPETAVGVNAGQAMPNCATSVVLSWVTNAYWRGGKPRSYIPGLPVGDTVTDDRLTAAADTSWSNSAQQFLTAVNQLAATGITQTQLVLMSFQSGGAPRNPPIMFPVVGSTVHPRLGTQRRRLGPWIP